MRTEHEWTAWGDEHPIAAGLMQLGIYALCWVGVIALALVAMFVLSLVVGALR